ncbi:MAG: precorrin-6A synthase (deacetylating) [Solirubrobacteraceae bacterium]|nr:precorrin-6A synthase (deacetylating) [Solirubrobacteraceae bacterium]
MSADDAPQQATDVAQARVLLIGIGAGDPDYVTTQAALAIRELDVLFVVTNEEEQADLVHARREVVDRYRDDDDYRTVELRDPDRPWKDTPHYADAVAHWRSQRVELWEAALAEHLAPGQTGGFLIWGDPSLYESTLSIVAEVQARSTASFDYEVLPGVSSIHALTARHRIPLNRQGGAVQITPARLLGSGIPASANDVVVMLDPSTTFMRLDPTGLEIYWGAYLGTPDELLIAGPLEQVRDEIVRVRAEAKERKGWIFDTYLIRRVLAERRTKASERRVRQVERRAGEIERRSGHDRRATKHVTTDYPPMPGGAEVQSL